MLFLVRRDMSCFRLFSRVFKWSCTACPNLCSNSVELHGGKRRHAHLSACSRCRNLLNLKIAGICPGLSKGILRFLPASRVSPASLIIFSRSVFGEMFSSSNFNAVPVLSSISIAFASCSNQWRSGIFFGPGGPSITVFFPPDGHTWYPVVDEHDDPRPRRELVARVCSTPVCK